MSWLMFAFSGPILWALSAHFDKYLVEKYFKQSHVAVLLIFTALIGLFALPVIWLAEPRVMQVGLRGATLMVFSGMLYMTGMLFYLRALQAAEASVVAPFYQAAPLFGYILGYEILGEQLSDIQIIGGALIIFGAVIASVQQKGTFNIRLAALMLMCAFVLSISSLIFKIFAVRDEFWPTTFWMYAGEAVFGVVLLAVRTYRDQFMGLLRKSPTAVMSVNAANELINLGGGLGNRYALVLAPLSLVQAIGGTTTIFVFIFGIVLSILYPALGHEDLSSGEVIRKGCAAVLVALGTILVNW